MPLRVGIVGLGKFGCAHLRAWQHLESQIDVKIAGVYDHNPEKVQKIKEQFGVKPFNSFEELLYACDAVDIVTPTNTHYVYAIEAILGGKHVFIEKPMTTNLREAEKLVAEIKKTGVKAQIGYIERFNAAFITLSELTANLPVYYMSATRESPFSTRGTEVSVVLDLMSHDIDLILNLLKKVAINNVSASGMAVFSPQIDIAEARIEFANGAIATLRASRAGISRHRRLTLFTEDGVLSADLLSSALTIYCKPGSPLHKKLTTYLSHRQIPVTAGTRQQFAVYRLYPPRTDALTEELKSFALAIINNRQETAVPPEQALKTLQIASQISERIEVFVLRTQPKPPTLLQ